MTPIQMTPIGEKLFSKTPERAGGYLEIVERFYVDQYGHQWHSFHSRIVFDYQETGQRDNLATDKTDKSEAE